MSETPERTPSEHRPFPAARSTFNIRSCLDVAEVSCNAWSVGDIVKAEPAHQRAVLQEKGERLANASRGPQHCYLGIVLSEKEDKHVCRDVLVVTAAVTLGISPHFLYF